MDLNLGVDQTNSAILSVRFRPPKEVPQVNEILDQNSTDKDNKTISDSEQSKCSGEEEEKCRSVDDIKKGKKLKRIRHSREEYRCTTCPYTCTTEKAFIRHSRVCDSNYGVKIQSISCPVCGKDRKGKDLLDLHMKKHRNERYFCCDMCIFKTVQLKKLIQHRRMHTGEKPHLCPFCYYRSSRRDNLRSHVRRVHKQNDLPGETFVPRNIIITPSKSVAECIE